MVRKCPHCGARHPNGILRCTATGRPIGGDPDLVGRLVAGRYQLVRLLGDGGMGAVYKAADQVLRRFVAIKLLHPAVAANPSSVERFQREARAAAAIGHPNIIDILDFGREDTRPYMVMEYVRGRSLSQVIAMDGQLAVKRASTIAIHTLAGLQAAHDRGILHRDLKPANLMLVVRFGDRNFVKVCDFGFAALLGGGTADAKSLTPERTLVGTPAYAAPERLRGDDRRDPRLDVYSVGVVLYEMLAGKRPFDAPTFRELARKVRKEPPPPLRAVRSDVPEVLERVVMRALEKDREARWPSAEAFAEALFPFGSLKAPFREEQPSDSFTMEMMRIKARETRHRETNTGIPVLSRTDPARATAEAADGAPAGDRAAPPRSEASDAPRAVPEPKQPSPRILPARPPHHAREAPGRDAQEAPRRIAAPAPSHRAPEASRRPAPDTRSRRGSEFRPDVDATQRMSIEDAQKKMRELEQEAAARDAVSSLEGLDVPIEVMAPASEEHPLQSRGASSRGPSVAPEPPAEPGPAGSYNGRVVLAILRFVARKFGERALKDVLDSMPPARRAPFVHGIADDSWVDLLAVRTLIEQIDALLGKDDLHLVLETGRAAAEGAFDLMRDLRPPAPPPELLVAEMPNILKQVIRGVACEVRRVGRGYGRLELLEGEEPSLTLAVGTLGFLARSLERFGADDVEVSLLSARALEDPQTLIDISWFA